MVTGKVLHILEGHSDEVNVVAIAPDNRTALSSSDDCTLKLWDLAAGEELDTLEGHTGVSVVAIAPDSRTALSGSGDGTLKLWDLATGKELRTLKGHSDPVNAVAILPDSRTALSGSENRTLKLWDLAMGEVLATFTADAPINCCAIAADGRIVVAGDSAGRLYLLSLEGVFIHKHRGDDRYEQLVITFC